MMGTSGTEKLQEQREGQTGQGIKMQKTKLASYK